MTSTEGSGRLPSDLDDIDEDAAPKIRRFLEVIAGSADAPAKGRGTTTAPTDRPARLVDRDRQVMRFAWSCEELNVAFAAMDPNDKATLDLLVEHGVGLTLAEIQQKAALLAEAIERADQARLA